MPAAVPFEQIFGNRARFDDDAILVLDHRRFAERMDGDQFGRCEIGDRIAVVIFDLIGCADFLEQRSEEHTSELQSLMRISYAVFCLKKKTQSHKPNTKCIKDHHAYRLQETSQQHKK